MLDGAGGAAFIDLAVRKSLRTCPRDPKGESSRIQSRSPFFRSPFHTGWAPAQMLSSEGIKPATYGAKAVPVKYCHWICVVLLQFVRELVYILLGLVYKVRRVLICRKSPVAKKGSLLATKRVCFVRHGQGDHNASLKGWQLVDPPLNATGEEQVKKLAEEMKPQLSEFDLIVTSPLTRAMQTATGGFAGEERATVLSARPAHLHRRMLIARTRPPPFAPHRLPFLAAASPPQLLSPNPPFPSPQGCNAPFMVNALLRERMGAPCDTGRTKSELLLSFPRMVRWAGIDELEEVWWSESWIEWDLLSRVEELEDWISARPEKTIAVVGHGGLFSR